MVKPVDRWVKKYEARASVATDDYRWGIENPAVSPTGEAIAHRKDLETIMADKRTWDRWEEGLRFVGDEGWKKGALEKGVDRYVPGVRTGLPKVSDFATKFRGHLEAGIKEVKKLPFVTLDDSIRRATEMIKHNAKFRYKRK